MFSYHIGHTVAILLAFTQGLVFASLKDDANERAALFEIIANTIKFSRFNGMDSILRSDSSENLCANETEAYEAAIEARETWALQMLDSSSKIQSGILMGNIRDLGMYGQCMNANGIYNDTEVKGKHCMVSMTLVDGVTRSTLGDQNYISIGSSICVPSSCEEAQVFDFVNYTLSTISDIGDFGLTLTPTSVSCSEKENENFTIGEIITIVFFSLVGFFILSCTICDIFKRTTPAGKTVFIKDTLAKFSIYTNGIALLSTKMSQQTMPALQGLRVLSMAWVMLGHRFLLALLTPTVNLSDIPEWSNSWSGVYIQAATFAVDTFFVISGFLMTYQFLKLKQSGRSYNIPMAMVHRYLRLTPSLVVLILFVTFLLHRVSSGPVWYTLDSRIIDSCRKNWWINLFYVQNFVKNKNICLSHTWYLAVDMQLFWFAPIVLFPLYHWPKKGFALFCILFGASVIIPAVTLGINGYTNAAFRFDRLDKVLENFNDFYMPTYNRASAYFVGVFLAYDVTNRKRILTKTHVAIGWVMTFIFTIFCICATHHIYNTNYPYNQPFEILFALLLRPCWSIAMGWIVYACTQGYGGIITRILSLSIFLPLSRLSYCIYLVHIVLQITKNAAVKIPQYFDDFELINNFFADFILSVIIAFVFCLFFESPIIVLEKLIKTRERKTKLPDVTEECKFKNNVEKGIQNEGVDIQ